MHDSEWADRPTIIRRIIYTLIGVVLALGIVWYWPSLAGAQAAPAGQQAPLTVSWVGRVLHIVTAPPDGCLWLIGAGKQDTPLPDSCGVTGYTIGYNYLSDQYNPVGRTLIKVGYDGSLLARVQIPDPRLRTYFPVFVAPAAPAAP